MSMRLRSLLILTGAVCVLGAAQAQAPATDPLFVAAPDALQPGQMRDLQKRLSDWPQLAQYRTQNAALPALRPARRRVVFYGDSITEGWGAEGSPRFFPGKGYLNRGISGQTTAQMLLRFRQDVIALQPAVVVILAGTNDIAGNTGPATLAMIEDNLHSMVELAQAHGIRVVLASVLPVSAYPWRPGLRPADIVRVLNTALKRYADAHQLVYLDYHAALANAQGGLDPALAEDGVHPTAAGYAKMSPLAEAAVAAALAR